MGLLRFVVGVVFIALLAALIWAIVYGRRLIRTEKTDAVFGNPIRALGGWHWVISGVATILLLWLYFSWDAARAFFPKAANEMCQVAKVTTALNPVRTVFPMQSRVLRGTTFLARDLRQLENLEQDIESATLADEGNRAQLLELVQAQQDLLRSRADPDSLGDAVAQQLDDVTDRLNAVVANFADPNYPGPATEEEAAAAAAQPAWGESSTEIPMLPETERGRKFDAVSGDLATISSDFTSIRNKSPEFEQQVDELNVRIDALRESADPRVAELAKELNKILKRVDDGTVFPPNALSGIEQALVELDDQRREQAGSLNWINALAMPGGEILAGNTACSEQGSGRWLPKPSDTIATLVRISDPEIGYKGIPLLWYEMKPVGEMLAFFIPDWIADLIPGEYPRHSPDGSINENLKSRVLNFATGDYVSPKVPVPSGHLWDSVMRVLAGLFLGIVLGVPLGLFMGLSRFAKGFFDPLIELYRPVPPLAWAPLILTIFGIQDDGKIFLLFMVAFAIMVISARTGATGTQLSKIHAAHSLGASNRQIIRGVILPNSLPEILTGIRISIGVCWGTLVAAEMLAGTTGIGFVENVARKQADYEIIWVTIILLGFLGLLFDLIMRWIINRTIPWRGKG